MPLDYRPLLEKERHPMTGRLLTLALATIAILGLCAGADASSYYLATDGYYYAPGSTQAYTRTSSWQPAYYYNGCYHQGYYTYSYTPYYAPAPSVTVKLSPSDPNWRTELLKVAAARDEAKAYQDALNALGIQQPTGLVSHTGYGYGNN